MHFITLAERNVERCDNVGSRNLHRVTKMTRRTIDSYLSEFVPRVGDTICLGDTQPAYDVLAVIYSKQRAANVDTITVEVTPHVPVHNHDVGGYSFKEDWPLITHLEEAPMD